MGHASLARAARSIISPSFAQQALPQNLFDSSGVQAVSQPFTFGIINHQHEYETSSTRTQPTIHTLCDQRTSNLHPIAIQAEQAGYNAQRLLNVDMTNQMLLAQQTIPPPSVATPLQDFIAKRTLQLLQQQQRKDHRPVDHLASKEMHLLLQQEQQLKDQLRVDQTISLQQKDQHTTPLDSNTVSFHRYTKSLLF